VTLIVGLAAPDGAWLASDSYYGSRGLRDALKTPKYVAYSPRLAIGWAGCFRPAQVVRDALASARRQRRGESDRDFILDVVVERVRAAHAAYGALGDGESKTDWGAVIAYRTGVYELQGDYSVLESARGYSAVGTGDTYALTALAALARVAPKLDPVARLRAVCESTADHCGTVMGPFPAVQVVAR
jgi:ATP-dependent protease HslVU (ClpYQ) peptidase subunit